MGQMTAAVRELPGYLANHVLISAAALALGLVLSLPLAVVAARSPRVRWVVLAVAGLVQTVAVRIPAITTGAASGTST